MSRKRRSAPRKIPRVRRDRFVRNQKFDGALYFERKTKAVELLGGRCEKCGEDDYYVLHFHHTGRKRYALSEVFGNPLISWEAIEVELRVCKLLCANDHARFHADERKRAWEERTKG